MYIQSQQEIKTVLDVVWLSDSERADVTKYVWFILQFICLTGVEHLCLRACLGLRPFISVAKTYEIVHRLVLEY